MSLQNIANDLRAALETGVLSPFCEDRSLPPMQTIRNVFWDSYTRNNAVAYERLYDALDFLCDQGYLIQRGQWYRFA
ncbi:hypothetical protein QF212_20930 [Providencia stuartii]|uniref:hypothetical protein n=1 Tax=Providencia TaxID=586 RepID=UPI0022B6D334|nr:MULTISPECIES: hypothetical protein [Providencia]MDT7048336.1 hypothetical protein [Providencia stuartii]WBA58415.1 hypothetical protein O7C57_07560 [Providencia sp. 21OH12SH02B-Prov]